jgi:hypothetical protein
LVTVAADEPKKSEIDRAQGWLVCDLPACWARWLRQRQRGWFFSRSDAHEFTGARNANVHPSANANAFVHWDAHAHAHAHAQADQPPADCHEHTRTNGYFHAHGDEHRLAGGYGNGDQNAYS